MFGPVAGLTLFDNGDEAIALANDSADSLAAYFHTRDYARLLPVAERLEYGVVEPACAIAAAWGSVRNEPCSMERTPARTASSILVRRRHARTRRF
jgi:hypothetical protein